jgi:hypothetical protein
VGDVAVAEAVAVASAQRCVQLVATRVWEMMRVTDVRSMVDDTTL